MAQKVIRSDLHVAVKGGLVSGIGWVSVGDIAVDGHPVLARAAGYFRPLVPRFSPPDLALDAPPAAPQPAGTLAGPPLAGPVVPRPEATS